MLILNGSVDPIGGEAGGQALCDHYRAAGLIDVTFRSYEGGRHELLNETNRDEVTEDLLDWITARSG
jgi:alpha-beta hydrolase superfamily lysophospholipase